MKTFLNRYATRIRLIVLGLFAGALVLGQVGLHEVIELSTSSIVTGLGNGWTDQDIGSVSSAGSCVYTQQTFLIQGSGGDIWDRKDAFHFAYTGVRGDGQLTIR